MTDDEGSIPPVDPRWKGAEKKLLELLQAGALKCAYCGLAMKMGDRYLVTGFGGGPVYHPDCYRMSLGLRP